LAAKVLVDIIFLFLAEVNEMSLLPTLDYMLVIALQLHLALFDEIVILSVQENLLSFLKLRYEWLTVLILILKR
jgi:hypothetical protein